MEHLLSQIGARLRAKNRLGAHTSRVGEACGRLPLPRPARGRGQHQCWSARGGLLRPGAGPVRSVPRDRPWAPDEPSLGWGSREVDCWCAALGCDRSDFIGPMHSSSKKPPVLRGLFGCEARPYRLLEREVLERVLRAPGAVVIARAPLSRQATPGVGSGRSAYDLASGITSVSPRARARAGRSAPDGGSPKRPR